MATPSPTPIADPDQQAHQMHHAFVQSSDALHHNHHCHQHPLAVRNLIALAEQSESYERMTRQTLTGYLEKPHAVTGPTPSGEPQWTPAAADAANYLRARYGGLTLAGANAALGDQPLPGPAQLSPGVPDRAPTPFWPSAKSSTDLLQARTPGQQPDHAPHVAPTPPAATADLAR